MSRMSGSSSYARATGAQYSQPLQTSTTGPSRTSTTTPRLPTGTSFLFRIDDLRPNWTRLSVQVTTAGYWNPPFYWNAYDRSLGDLYRWRDGVITSVPPGTGTGQVFSCATVFTQSPSTQHLLVVEFDAQTQNVSEHGHWQSLGFNHVPHQSENALYSELDLGRRTSEDHLVAPPSQGRSEWMNELFTSQYQYNGQQDEVPAPNSAGLIGKLCFILAFVAFSRPARYLRSVLTTNVRPGQWNPHGMPEDGRTQYRGMVVTIWLDPQSNTTRAILEAMERGSYGPFFR